MNKDRYLVVVSGPSGIGKDTVVQRLMQRCPGIECSVSATTRPARSDEAHGVHYFFMSRDDFERRIAAGELLEHASYVGNYYGTLKQQVDSRIEHGITCVLVIEVEGAARVKQVYPECTTIFILPPSMEELERRLRSRGTEDEAWVQKRLARAREEMEYAESYDYTVVNHDVDACVEEIRAILQKRQR